MEISQHIEALLVYKAEPVTIKWLAKALGVSVEKIKESLDELSVKYATGSGLILFWEGESVRIVTHPDTADKIRVLEKSEHAASLSRAALETLTVVLYMPQVSKAEIDYIRGVNSQYSLRTLLVRGLVRKSKTKKKSSSCYEPTFELMSHLGITRQEELPDFTVLSNEFQDTVNNTESI